VIKAVKLYGSSMSPLFKEGDIVFVEERSQPLPKGWIKSGDCAVYFFEGKQLLHRVVSVANFGAIISDDAGMIKPHFVGWQDIVGKVLSPNPLKKYPAGIIWRFLMQINARI